MHVEAVLFNKHRKRNHPSIRTGSHIIPNPVTKYWEWPRMQNHQVELCHRGRGRAGAKASHLVSHEAWKISTKLNFKTVVGLQGDHSRISQHIPLLLKVHRTKEELHGNTATRKSSAEKWSMSGNWNAFIAMTRSTHNKLRTAEETRKAEIRPAYRDSPPPML